MIDIRESIVGRICGDTMIVAILGRDADGNVRFYRSIAPQKAARPLIVWQINQLRFPHWLTGSGSVAEADTEFTLYADDTNQLSILLGLVRQNLAEWNGITEGVQVRRALIVSESDGYVEPADGSETGVYLISIETTIQFIADQYTVDS